MVINKVLRKHVIKLLPKNYRAIVVERLKAKGKTIHPNTVRNVLHGSANLEVALEILKLYNEQRALQQAFDDAIVEIPA